MFNIKSLLFGSKLDEEELFALSWKIPEKLEIEIKESDGMYVAKITSYKDDNVVTQAKTGQQLVKMVNDALYSYLDIPGKYKDDIGFFMPPKDVREELKYEVPKKYLNRKIGLARA